MSWVEKDLRHHPLATPWQGQGHLPADQAAESPIHPGPEHFQGWGIHSFSVLWPVPHHPHSKGFPPNVLHKSHLSV